MSSQDIQSDWVHSGQTSQFGQKNKKEKSKNFGPDKFLTENVTKKKKKFDIKFLLIFDCNYFW